MKFFFTLLLLAAICTGSFAQQITEIHYDNTGADANERIEITVPTGTNITGWNVILYNGAGGVSYNTTLVSSGTLTTQAGFDIYVISYAVNAIQNGAPDGVALVNAASTVLQLISYEGSFVATNGPATGLTLPDILAAENGMGTVDGSIQFNSITNAWVVDPSQNSFGQLNGGVLPVKFTKFTATESAAGIALSWTCYSDVSALHYTVEESTDGVTFYEKAKVEAKQQQNNYTAVVATPLAARAYYRIKQTDVTGKQDYSATLSIIPGRANTDNTIRILANPVHDKTINLAIAATKNQMAGITVINATGAVVVNMQKNITAGQNLVSLDAANLAAGIYTIVTTLSNERYVSKVVKL
jgi:hypothetical protein